MDQQHIQAVLDFWFGSPDSAERGSARAIWFQENTAFDHEIQQRFGHLHQQAAAGLLQHWLASADGCLALIILLDQFSRNLFRNDARAYASDELARHYASYGLTQGYDRNRLSVERVFHYLPFEHAEDLNLQNQSVELFKQLGVSGYLQHAICHRDQIIRFGRFPGRNAALQRANTPAEIAFLKNPFC
jgi:uncharacterized protein (DUF924 family)